MSSGSIIRDLVFDEPLPSSEVQTYPCSCLLACLDKARCIRHPRRDSLELLEETRVCTQVKHNQYMEVSLHRLIILYVYIKTPSYYEMLRYIDLVRRSDNLHHLVEFQFDKTTFNQVIICIITDALK